MLNKNSKIKEPAKIRLADFISKNTQQIVSEWKTFAKTLTPAANDMTPLALRNHIIQILSFIIEDINSPQTSSEQIKKSRGEKERNSKTTVAETHAALRLAGGFDIDQMVSEYRALRASIIKLWSKSNGVMDSHDVLDLIRFNEAIDQELAESVSYYTEKVSYSKDLFIGILSHELRNPINVISLAAQLLLKISEQNDREDIGKRRTMLSGQIIESTSRITNMIDSLLDVTRARFGSGLPLERTHMDMGAVGYLLVSEMMVANPARSIVIDVSGEVTGEWDQARIGQVFSNLIGNAIQYSFKNSIIKIAVKGNAKEVKISVHNVGQPIPPEKITTIFDSLIRANIDEGEHKADVNLGLGLYITKEIVNSHGGTIEVASTEKDGTTFTVKFPKNIILDKD